MRTLARLGAIDDHVEHAEIERLREVMVGALLYGFDGVRDRPESRHHDEHDRRVRGARFLHEPDAVEPRHLEIREDDVGVELVELAERLEAVRRRLGDVAFLVQDLGERSARVRLVIDDENSPSRGHAHSFTTRHAEAVRCFRPERLVPSRRASGFGLHPSRARAFG
jgi:hypothetical protein